MRHVNLINVSWRFLAVIGFLLFHHSNFLCQVQCSLPFDSFQGGNTEDVKARLDNFAIELQENSSDLGYIIMYGPDGEGSGTVYGWLQLDKYYLVSARGIDAERIKTINGGRYEKRGELATVLWIIPPEGQAPEPRRYEEKDEIFRGKFDESERDDSIGNDDGPDPRDIKLAGFAELLRQQPNDVAYLVAFNLPKSTPGAWRRAANKDAEKLQGNGVNPDRVKLIYGGIKGDSADEEAQQAVLQLWIVAADAPPPVKEAKPERTPKEAVLIGSYPAYGLASVGDRNWAFQGLTDILKSDPHLTACLIYRAALPSDEEIFASGDNVDVDLKVLAETWRSELKDKIKIPDNRIVLLPGVAKSQYSATLEVWVVPLGATFPDPNEIPKDENEDPL